MKSKIFTLILALTVVSWAQTSSQTAPSDSTQNSAPADKAKASCCDKMAGNGASCPRHGKKDAKDMASCCGGKEMKDTKETKEAKDTKERGSGRRFAASKHKKSTRGGKRVA